MKKLFWVMTLLSLMGCATLPTQEKQARAEKKEQTAKMVRDNLASRNFTISVRQANPLRHPSIVLTTMYSLKIKGDSIYSYLPYYGQAYSVPYGGGKALNFDGTIEQYECYYPKKDLTRVILITRNEEDIYQYDIQVFENGNTTINVSSQKRDPISYYGDMEVAVKKSGKKS
jgi:hypothetical protein